MKHLQVAGKSYWQHMKFALIASFWLFVAGISSLIHAFFPEILKFHAKRIVERLYFLSRRIK